MANKTFVIQYIIKAREAYVQHADRVSKATKRMKKNFDAAQKSMKKFTERTKKAGKTASAFITTPIIAAAFFLKNAARDAEETEAKFGTVFKNISSKANKAAKDLAANYGMSRDQSKKLLSDTGDLLTGFGFTQDKALELSTQVNKLAVDLASFTNYAGGTEGASQALTKALLGEREALKSLGIVVSEELVKSKIKEMMAKGARFNTLQQAKAQATLAIAMEQSKNAIGDFARTSEGLANQERITAARLHDLKIAFGKILLPVALAVTKAIGKFAKWLTTLSPGAKKAVLAIAAIAAVIGPLLLGLAAVGAIIPALVAGFGVMATAATLAFGPIGIAIMAIVAAATLIISNWETVKGWFSSFWEWIKEVFAGVGEVIMTIFNPIKLATKAIGLIGDFFSGEASTEIEKTERRVAETTGTMKQSVGVQLQVGLDKGLKQQGAAAVTTTNMRRDDVALAGA